MGKKSLDDDGFLHRKRPKFVAQTVKLERTLIEPDYFTDQELSDAKGGVLIFDLEIYPNYFLAAFQCYFTKKAVTFDLFPGRDVFDQQKLLWVMHNFCTIGFNSNRFDIPLIWMAISGATVDDLIDACVKIIKGNARPREIEAEYHFKANHTNTIDLIEVAPLTASLKAYASRVHAPRLQDLPFDPQTYLSEEEANEVKLYCVNDLECTALLCKDLEPQLSLRTSMSGEYGIDLRSKSDAQIAETVLCSEVAKLNEQWPRRPKVATGSSFRYKIPDYVYYKTPVLQNMLEMVRTSDFVIQENGHVQIPKWLESDKKKNKKCLFKIGDTTYRMGIGGLHSTEESVTFISTDDYFYVEPDVASFYPRTILNQNLYPAHMGHNFNVVYDTIVETRLAGKRNGDKVVADSLKIVINASFGKLSNKWSNLYSPENMIQITITGQLALLMMIEAVELAGIAAVSANTDGVLVKCYNDQEPLLNSIIKEWEEETGYTMESDKYKAVYKRDVNNFIGIKESGKLKRKGVYKAPGLQKNPTLEICTDAVIAFIENGVSIEKTIKECKDITKFVIARNVKGGAFKDGIYLGKVVRFYFGKKELGTINYVLSGNKVPKSDGATPLMDLPDKFPDNVDYDRYVEESVSMLYDLGYLKRPTQHRFF